MRRTRLASALIAAATAVGLGWSAPATAAEPRPGPLFSDPTGDQITKRLLGNIKGSPSGSSIRVATAITHKPTAAALVRAYRRGVRVQVVMPLTTDRGCRNSAAAQRLRRVIGGDRTEPSWVRCVKGSARLDGRGGHMHMKVWAFSATHGGDGGAPARKVVVVTSQNSTMNADEVQYNSGYQSVGWDELYDAFVTKLFPELGADAGGGYWQATWGASGAYATPVSAANDPVPGRIAAIPGKGAVIRVAMSAFSYNGDRPLRIAAQLIAKRRQGADVRVLYTQPADKRQKPPAVRRLVAAGVPVFKHPNNRRYLHDKFMTATYFTTSGAKVHRVWLGSEEFKQDSLRQDEFVLQLGGAGTVAAFAHRWGWLRKHGGIRVRN